VEIGRVIVAAIAAGNFPSVSARIAGIKPGTLTKWLERGDQGEQPYADFAAAFQRAETQCEAEAVAKWRSADDFRAQERFLSKRFKENWGDRAEVTGPGMISSIFKINIHTGPRPRGERKWNQSVERRSLELENSAIDVTNKPIVPVKDPNPDSGMN